MSAPSYADSPRSVTNYLGQSYRFTPTYIRKRNPTTADIRPKENQGYYPIGSIWINVSTPPEIWILAAIKSSGGQPIADWVLIANSLIVGPLLTLSDNAGLVVPPSSDVSNPPGNIQLVAGAGITIVGTPASNLITITNTGMASTETLTGDDGVAVSPSGGTIQTLGNTVANATHAKALFTTNSAGNIERFDIQVSAAIGATNIANVGLAAFSNAQFAVDGNGFVTLIGGSTPPTLGIVPDAHTAPGTTPVVPNGSGNIILEGGATFATGTQANPIRTNSLAANTIDLQIQLAGSNAAVSTANNFGVSQFDSNSFGVASGFVTLNNAGTTGAVTKVLGDDGGGNTVVPSSGIITWLGSTVANATNAKPVFFKKNAASTEELDVQLTTTSTSGAKNINKSGLCHFDSTDFTVDAATGFVQLVGGATAAIQTITGNDSVAVSGSGTPVNVNIVGTGSITTSGAASTETIALTGLTNHAVLVGAGTATITKIAATANTGAVLQNNSGADPSYSTATYPSTTTINQILYSSAANTVTGLATANSATLVTNSTGVPSWTASMTNGQILIGSTGATPTPGTITAGTGITVTNGAGTITIATANGAPVTQFTLDAATSPISPSSGNITLTGGQVATGVVGANVIRTRGNTGSSCTIEIQRSTVSAGSDSTKNGVCHFNSTQFSVDANGFVQAISIGTFPWTDEGGNFNASSNNGYFCTAALTATLPGAPAQGDIVRIVADTASTVTIAANTGQKIRLGNVISALAGTAASTKIGDAMELVYRASSATWYNFGSPVGAWSIT